MAKARFCTEKANLTAANERCRILLDENGKSAITSGLDNLALCFVIKMATHLYVSPSFEETFFPTKELKMIVRQSFGVRRFSATRKCYWHKRLLPNIYSTIVCNCFLEKDLLEMTNWNEHPNNESHDCMTLWHSYYFVSEWKSLILLYFPIILMPTTILFYSSKFYFEHHEWYPYFQN